MIGIGRLASPRTLLRLALAASTMIVFASCTLPWFDLDGGRGGKVHISIVDPLFSESLAQADDASAAKTITPSAGSLNLTTYIEAFGPPPDNLHISPILADSSTGHTFSNLAAGSWTFNATGKSGSNVVTSGTTMVTVTVNQAAAGTITMNPAVDVGYTGSYAFVVNWPSGQGVAAPAVSLKILGSTTDASPGPTMNPLSAGVQILGSGLAPGSYTLDLTLTRAMATIHLVETLQVYNGLSSTKTTTLTLDDFTARPAAPSGFTAQASNRTVVLNWTDNAFTENGFVLERKVGAGDWAVLSSSIAANAETYTDSDVSYANTYQYRINAVNDNGYSSASPTVDFLPTRVTGLSLVDPPFYIAKQTAMSMLTYAVILPATPFDNRIVWESSNSAVAVIDGHSGYLTGCATGTSTITATSIDGAYSDSLVVTVTEIPSITAFAFMKAQNETEGVSSDCYGIITGQSIAVTVPYGTTITALKASFATSGDGGPGGSIVRVNSTPQTSGSTANSFTNPVTYQVVIGSCAVNHTVTVSFAQPGTAGLEFVPNPQLAVSLTGVPATLELGTDANFGYYTTPPGTVDGYQWYMDGETQAGWNGSSLTTGASLAAGAHRVGLAVYKDIGGYLYRFSAEASFVVTLPSAKMLSYFAITSPKTMGTIDEGAKTVSVVLPYGSSTSSLTAAFSTTGTSVTIDDVPQESRVSVNAFSPSLVYRVHAIDGTYADYTVTVTVALNPAKAISSFSFASPTASGTINESAGTIAVTVPYGTDRNGLVASFATSGSLVKVGETEQTSGTTPNDFTDPVSYVVHAEDGSTKTYVVTVSRDDGRITYVGNGHDSGSPPVDSFGYSYGQVVTVLGKGSLAKQGYYLKSWNTLANGTGTTYMPGQSFPLENDDVALYAQWQVWLVGDTGPAKGIIFYDAGAASYGIRGWRFLEAAPSDQATSIRWSINSTVVSGTLSDITAGAANTLAIVIATTGEEVNAAMLCQSLTLNGYDDWYLPSLNALTTMYTEMAFKGIGGLTSSYYWSSSQYDSSSTNAYVYYMGSGYSSYYSKTNQYYVRAIRQF